MARLVQYNITVCDMLQHWLNFKFSRFWNRSLHWINTLRPGVCIFVLRFRPKNSSFWLPYQRPSSFTACARAVQGLKRIGQSSRLHSKKIFWLGSADFLWRHHKWSSFGVILAHVAGPRAQPLGQSVSLKFSLETRLESVSWAFDWLSSISGSKAMI